MTATPKVNIKWHAGKISHADRCHSLQQRPATIWFTGLSGSGKSTLAYELEQSLVRSGRVCYVLDGDNVRHGLNRDLGFSPQDRTENIRRIAEVAALFNDAGVIVISAFISPYLADREQARKIIGADNFVEVYLETPLTVCEGRDPKGLYAKARAGQLRDFTGIDAPYEAPASPDLALNTGSLSVTESIARLEALLQPRLMATNSQ